ncbi:hypothetical protein BGAL_0286g00080 [Botrytis galanthina]|uniref:Uncharacterized protein n=1 Tax=Botrytis galanthina TaxID=278940 RepID=A0A4S8R3U8_9HELO|nr:hypothetical protein BGAL_0286g00080 [Botrytis galanthina]
MYDDEHGNDTRSKRKRTRLRERKEEGERHRINWTQDEGDKDFPGSSLAWHTSYFTTLCWTSTFPTQGFLGNAKNNTGMEQGNWMAYVMVMDMGMGME